jgi:hypothetical protein
MTVAEWLEKQGYVLDGTRWVIPGADDKLATCIEKTLVDQAEADSGVASLIFSDVRTRQRVTGRGIDQHPRINEWTRKGKVQ